MSSNPPLSRSRASSLSRSNPNQPHAPQHRPTTPLRRISSSSLRALSLSHSASRRSHAGALGASTSSGTEDDAELDHLHNTAHQLATVEAPLVHLAPILAELADSVSDLTSNLDALELVHARLDGFNDALAAYLLGLRANGYTVDFQEAPTRLNFEMSAQARHDRFLKEEEERVLAQLHARTTAADSDSDADQFGGDDGGGAQRGDATFISAAGTGGGSGGADASFVSNHGFSDGPTPTRGGRAGIPRGSGVRGGRGGAGARGGARGGGTLAGRKRKEEMATFADPILPLLPIDIREKRRAETEKVLWSLRERPNGTTMQDLVASLSAGGAAQAVPQVRINECILALVRAKVVVRAVVKGATTYRLDPNKCAV